MKDKIFNIYGQLTYNEISDNKNCLIIPSADTQKAETKYVSVEDVEHTDVITDYFRYIVAEGKTKQKIKEIDDDLRAVATEGKASDLVEALAYHQALGDINIVYVPTRRLYDTLNQRYGLHYNYDNFRKVRTLNPIITKR